MKKVLAFLLCIIIVLSLSVIGYAEFDLSGMSYDELVALKDKINLAIWNSEEWQEVEVPQGIWEVGSDIPPGKWEIKPLAGSVVAVYVGDSLYSNGHVDSNNSKFIKSSERNSFDRAEDVTSWVFEIKDGQYLEVDDGIAVFMPYSGKPSLGFKSLAASDTPKEEQNNSIYSNAQVVDVMSGTGTKKVGTMTKTTAKREDCTEEALLDWYFNYIKNNSDSNYHIIVYDDVPYMGVHCFGNVIEKDVTLISEKDGTYSIGDDAGSTVYTVNEDLKTLNELIVMADDSVIEDVQEKIDAVIPDDYKNSESYYVDVAGEEGALECYLTIVNGAFADADYQSIATKLASEIKGLNLGISYFSIYFYSNDYSMEAVSMLDDLSEQDVAEISTMVF